VRLSPELLWQIDELTRKDLQGFRDWYFMWLLIATGVVVLGIMLEGPEVIHETVNILRSPCRRKEPSAWIRWMALVGWLLVVVGVAGEGIFEVLVSHTEGLLQNFNEIVLIDTQHESAQAEERAGEATALAKGFESQIADANVRVKTAEAIVASANAASREAVLKVARAEARIAEANARTEELRKENLILEQLIQPRSLSIQQQKDIGNALLRFNGGVARIDWKDPESYHLALQIEAALKCGGISVTVTIPGGSSNGLWFGPPPGIEKSTGVEIAWPKLQKDFGLGLGSALIKYGKLENVNDHEGGSEVPPNPKHPVLVTVFPKPLKVLAGTAPCTVNNTKSKH